MCAVDGKFAQSDVGGGAWLGVEGDAGGRGRGRRHRIFPKAVSVWGMAAYFLERGGVGG